MKRLMQRIRLWWWHMFGFPKDAPPPWINDANDRATRLLRKGRRP